MSRLPWHGPLFAVRGHLAERYAAALRQVTGKECPLDDFSVDRMGWSPQLAAVFGDDYLGAGALRYAIILSPNQADAPPLRRRFSYEAPLIEMAYLDARPTLLSLVADEPVVVELDSGLTFCRTAVDVLNIQLVRATLDTPRATLANGRRLLDLAAGLNTGARLLDESYIDRMLQLVAQVGDPRKRPQAAPSELRVGSLWAEVYGGVYVLRPPAGAAGTTLVVAVRPDDELARLPVVSFALDDPGVVDRLHADGWLRFPDPAVLLPRRLADLETDALLAAGVEPDAEGERRRQIARSEEAQGLLPDLYWELDGERKRVAAGTPFAPQRLTVQARWSLSAPARDADVVGHLLSRFVRYDYRLLAQHHRRSLQAEWPRYSEAKRRYLVAAFPYMTQGFVHGDARSSLEVR